MNGRIDLFGWLLIAILAALALAAGAALIAYEHLSLWDLSLGLFIGLAFVAVGLPAQNNTTPKNTLVHVAAKPASESEAQAAARGDRASPALHDRTFSD
jgi:hypothetical protein